jgi:NitT/TauT family transport system substrate-binding protein
VRTIDLPVPAASGQIVSRRELLRLTLGTGAMLAGGGLLAACTQQPAALGSSASLPPPETTTVRIATPFACDPPLWLAKDFLLEEGFTDVRYVGSGKPRNWAASGTVDFGAVHPEEFVAAIDGGAPLVVLAGIHSGCQEVWVGPGIAALRDLRGKSIAVFAKNTGDQFFNFFATTLAYGGIDPVRDVTFFEVGPDYAALMKAFVDGRSDAFLAAADGAAVLRRNPRTPSTKILDQSVDKPWSQYVCCMLTANRDWARQHPVATKRFTRAVMHAADATVKDLPRAAHLGAAGGFQPLLEHPTALSDEQIINETIAMPSYDWRELDPEETVRFFALRLGDVKLIKSTPQQILNQGSDVSYLRQLQKELKP